MSRGVTLIEMLLAVTLLSGVAVVTATWMSVVARSQTEFAPSVRWESAARATLDLIADDLASWDSAPRAREPRIRASQESLVIRTRSGTDDSVTYRVRQGRLTQGESVLLGECEWVRFDFDEETGVLEVALERDGGRVMQRSYRVEPPS